MQLLPRLLYLNFQWFPAIAFHSWKLHRIADYHFHLSRQPPLSIFLPDHPVQALFF
jgi:hypothetical protein